MEHSEKSSSQNHAQSTVGLTTPSAKAVGHTALPKLQQLPAGFRQLGIGEIVRDGDYLQLHNTFFPVDGSAWIGEEIQHGGTFERVWGWRK